MHTVVESMEQYIADFKTSQCVVHDNRLEFVSQQFQDLCRRHYILMHHTTSYHPRGNSTMERAHSSFKTVLAILCAGYPLKWLQYLTSCQTVSRQPSNPTLPSLEAMHPRQVNSSLPSIAGDSEGLEMAQEIICQTHLTQTRQYREVANRLRTNQAVSVG